MSLLPEVTQARHQNIIDALLQGEKPMTIASDLGMSVGNLYGIIRTPMFKAAYQAYLEKVQDKKSQIAADELFSDPARTIGRLTLLPQALNLIESEMSHGDRSSDRLGAAKLAIDVARNGQMPTSKTTIGMQQNLTQSNASIIISDESAVALMKAADATAAYRKSLELGETPGSSTG